jgi:polygalacturonase
MKRRTAVGVASFHLGTQRTTAHPGVFLALVGFILAAAGVLAGCDSSNAPPTPLVDASASSADAKTDGTASDATSADGGSDAPFADGGLEGGGTVTTPFACVNGDGGPNTSTTVNTPFDGGTQLTFTTPSIPCKTFDIRSYFGDAGIDATAASSGTAKLTSVFKSAVADAVAAGGGVVNVPPGTWLTGPIHLANNVELHVDGTILFSPDPADYGFIDASVPTLDAAVNTDLVVPTRFEGLDLLNGSPFIYCFNCTNVAITGSGLINGQGKYWWSWKGTGSAESRGADSGIVASTDPTIIEERAVYDAVYAQISNASPATPSRDSNGNIVLPFSPPVAAVNGALRPVLVQCYGCTNFLLQDVTVQDGAFWTVVPVYSSNVIIRGAHIGSGVAQPLPDGGTASNGDGVDVDSCDHVLIENTSFSTSDDNIAIKSGVNEDGIVVNRPSQNIVIRGVTSQKGHGGVTIGSEMSGGVHNVYATNSLLNGSGIQAALRTKTLAGRGGVIDGVWSDGVTVDNWLLQGIIITTSYVGGNVQPNNPTLLPQVQNMYFHNILGPDGGPGTGQANQGCDLASGNSKALDAGGQPCPPVLIDGITSAPGAVKNVFFDTVSLTTPGSTASCQNAPDQVHLVNVTVPGITPDDGGAWACP